MAIVLMDSKAGRAWIKQQGGDEVLILTRRIREDIVITTAHGDEIVIKLVAANEKGKARIGIEADRSVSIHRREVKEKIDAAPAN